MSGHDGCPMCESEAGIKPGRESAPLGRRDRVERWSMTPAEWAGEPPRRDRD